MGGGCREGKEITLRSHAIVDFAPVGRGRGEDRKNSGIPVTAQRNTTSAGRWTTDVMYRATTARFSRAINNVCGRNFLSGRFRRAAVVVGKGRRSCGWWEG